MEVFTRAWIWLLSFNWSQKTRLDPIPPNTDIKQLVRSKLIILLLLIACLLLYSDCLKLSTSLKSRLESEMLVRLSIDSMFSSTLYVTLFGASLILVWPLNLFFMGLSRPLFLLFSSFLFSKMFNMNFADDWIRTVDLWNWKRLLYQLSHNHCPTSKFVWVTILSFFCHCRMPKTLLDTWCNLWIYILF